MSDTTPPEFVFQGAELYATALHAQVLARRRATFEHDVKNVMHGLLSGAELLNKALTKDSARIPPAECLALLQQQLARAQGALHHLIEEIAPANSASADVALDALIAECTHDLRHELQRFELASTVEPRLIVRARRARLKDALLCMLLDSMDRAPPRSTLGLSARRHTDNATHIELRHAVLEPGSGDALAYVDEVLRADDAHIELTTDASTRTIVVRLPAVPAAQAEANARRLVIVDANRDAADSLAMLVQLEGFEAQVAYDVESAVQGVRSRATLAIVLDVDGSIDANGAIARLRAEAGAPGRIIGMSHSPEQRVAPVDAQLRKPLDPAELRAALNEG